MVMLAEDLKRRYVLTPDEAHELECGYRNWTRRIAARDEAFKHAESYRRRSDFHTPDPGQAARMASADPEAWQLFLAESNAALAVNDLNHGVSYSPPDRATSTLDGVRDYINGFGWAGVTSPQIAAAIKRDKRGVDRACAELLDMGEIAMRETSTRGKNASRRKVYLSHDQRPLAASPDCKSKLRGCSIPRAS